MKFVSKLIHEWGVRAFGAEHMSNKPLRALRTAEEAVELAQALGVPKELLHVLVDKVYERPAGSPLQEIGGLMVTIHALGVSLGVDPDRLMEREILRVLAKPPEHFAKRNQEKLDLGLDAK